MTKIPTIDSLHAEKTSKDKTRMNIFKIVLNKCVEKIVYTNRYTDQTFVVFEVPKILIDHPSYDMKSCILYIIAELSKHNYIVEFVEPFYIYIDWGSSAVRKEGKSENDKLRAKTKELLHRFPNTSKVEFVYQDSLPLHDRPGTRIKGTKKQNNHMERKKKGKK